MVIVITQWFQDFLKSKKTSMIIYLYTKIYTTSSVHSCTGVFFSMRCNCVTVQNDCILKVWFWDQGYKLWPITIPQRFKSWNHSIQDWQKSSFSDPNKYVKFLNVILIGKYRTYRWQCLIIINTPFTQHWLFGRA